MLPLQFIDEDGFIQQQNPFTGEWEIVSPEPARIPRYSLKHTSLLSLFLAALVIAGTFGKVWP